MAPPLPEPNGPGRRVLAFLFSFAWLTPLIVCIGVNLLPSSFILLLIPIAAWFASRLGRKSWLRFVTLTGLLCGGLFGHSLEGPEGAVWGSLIGLAAGFSAAWFSLWMLRKIPDRRGSIAGWALLGIAFTLTPLLLGIRLNAGRFDDDDSPFVLLSIGYGIFHAIRKGWTKLAFTRETTLPALREWLRFWTGRRAFPWVLAFIVAAIAAGPAGSHYHVSEDESLSIRLLPVSFVWPAALGLAAIASFLGSRKLPPNPFHTLFCAAALLFCVKILVSDARHHVEVTPARLHIRYGLWKSIALDNGQLASIRIEPFRARRVSSSYPVLVTASGKNHSLFGLTHSHLVQEYLGANWNIPVLPPPPR